MKNLLNQTEERQVLQKLAKELKKIGYKTRIDNQMDDGDLRLEVFLSRGHLEEAEGYWIHPTDYDIFSAVDFSGSHVIDEFESAEEFHAQAREECLGGKIGDKK